MNKIYKVRIKYNLRKIEYLIQIQWLYFFWKTVKSYSYECEAVNFINQGGFNILMKNRLQNIKFEKIQKKLKNKIYTITVKS